MNADVLHEEPLRVLLGIRRGSILTARLFIRIAQLASCLQLGFVQRFFISVHQRYQRLRFSICVDS